MTTEYKPALFTRRSKLKGGIRFSAEIDHVLPVDSVIKVAFHRNELLPGVNPVHTGNAAVHRAEEHDQSATTLLSGITLLAIALGMLFSWLIARSITRPLGCEPAEMQEVAERIAEGDLEVQFKNADRATGVYAALYNMSQRLSEVVGDIQTAASNTTSGSQQISSASQQLSQGSTEQAASLEEISTSMEQMAANIRQSANNAGQTEQIAQKAAGEIGEFSGNTVSVAEQAGEKLALLVPDIKKTAELVQEISVAAREQDAGVSEINSALQQLDQVVQQSAASSEEMAATSEELAAQSQQLNETISYFRLDSNAAVSALSRTPAPKPLVTDERRRHDSHGSALRDGKAKTNANADDGFEYDLEDDRAVDNNFVRY